VEKQVKRKTVCCKLSHIQKIPALSLSSLSNNIDFENKSRIRGQKLTVKEIWGDPVWSKVIAGVIVFILTAALAYFKGWLPTVWAFFRGAISLALIETRYSLGALELNKLLDKADGMRSRGENRQAQSLIGEVFVNVKLKKYIKTQTRAYFLKAEIESTLGNNREARDAFSQAGTLYQQVSNRLGEANVLRGLGDLERKLGNNREARDAFSQARTLYQQVNNRLGEANVLSGLGDLESALGNNREARDAYSHARTLYQQENNRLGEANVLRGLGDLERMLGNNREARDAYSQARTFYQQENHRLGEANVLMGLGALEEAHDKEAAKRFFYQAENIYQKLGMHEQEKAAKSRAERSPER